MNILCKCGCGQQVKWCKRRIKWNTYINTHHPKNLKPAIEASIKLRLGKPLTESTRIKISESRSGQISNHKGKKHSEETILKMSNCPRKREGYIGSGNPNWQGGISKEPYGLDFNNTLRLEIKERDYNTCQLCFSENILLPHHIDYDKSNNRKTNLITLCQGCNSKVNFNRDHWQEYFELLESIKNEVADFEN